MKRVALITGANRGLGFETARQLKERGYRVIVTGRDKAKIEAAAHQLGLEFWLLDVTSQQNLADLTQYINQEVGRLDVLVNNAAILLDETQSLLTISPELLGQTLEINSLAPLWLARAFLPLMFAQNYGRIVNVSSEMGQIADLDDDSPAYRLSKLLLNGITRILADGVKGRNVLVNAVCPGWVRTDMGGPRADLSPEEGAQGIVWAATLPNGGPQGGFFQHGKRLAW